MATRRVWLVTERAYGNVWGWRHFLRRHEAEETARRWRSQNVGVVTVEQVTRPDVAPLNDTSRDVPTG